MCFQNPPPLFNEASAAVTQAERASQQRREVQARHEEDYGKAAAGVREELELTEGADIREHLQDQIRRWFIECR